MTIRERPLSPFLQYRWQYSNTLSILHRITGVLMTVGLIVFVYWLAALAGGRASYTAALESLGSVPARAALVGWNFAFFYHLLNGVRHLVWDSGRGLERATARRSGWGVFVGAILATAAFWVVAAARLTGGAS